MEIAFFALAEAAIGWVDERFGRAAALVTALAMVALPIAAVIIVAGWLAR